MNKKNILLVAVVSLIAGGLVFFTAVLSRTTVVERVVDKIGAVSNIRNVGPELGINGLNTIVVSGTFVDATTTIVSVANPFPATATVTFIAIKDTGVATTSFYIGCGTSARASAPRVGSAPGNEAKLIPDTASSTLFQYAALSPTSTQQLAVNGYVQCVAHGILDADALGGDSSRWENAFTNALNTFVGTFSIEIKRSY